MSFGTTPPWFAFRRLFNLTISKRAPMTSHQRRHAPGVRANRLESFAKAEAKAREVLKERGLTPEQIEAQLTRPKRQDPYDL
jgi:hypothetical protein